jgi:imidazolonepropionase-like amidohydrolase
MRAALAFALLSLGVSGVASAALPSRGKAAPGEEIATFWTRLGIRLPEEAPRESKGAGPFKRLVLRGATLIDGTGAPPFGPVDIVIERNRITEVRSVGYPKVPIKPERRPVKGDHELDVSGKYVLPGFVDAHVHIAHPRQGLAGEVPPPEYVFRLWLAHGITSVRDAGSMMGLRWTLAHKKRSEANEIVAPRIVAYAAFPPPDIIQTAETVEEARAWVAAVASAGADGIKLLGGPKVVMRAIIEDAKKKGLRTAFHHAPLAVAEMNVLDTSQWGLTSMEHWYGLPEALFADRVVQSFPPTYDYNDEQDRFREAGRLWKQAARRGSPRYEEVIPKLIERDFTLVPTLTIYEATRDLDRVMHDEWHAEYTHPTLWRWFQPSRQAHGSPWFQWTTADEIAWKENYRLWMDLLNDYKNRGGRVCVGTDAGFLFKLFGFAYVRELELLQEAGFHPLEVVRSATLRGAELLGLDRQLGTVQVGKLADLVVVDKNPLENFKVLYGTGTLALDDATGKVERAGGVRYTIKDGIIYDAKALLEEARALVAAQKAKEAHKTTPR